MKDKNRSYKKIEKSDLRRLAKITRVDREDLFERNKELGNIYKKKLLCVALCQGAALHYANGKKGIKDFDVWSFYIEAKKRPFPYRRRVSMDFGDPKFGKEETKKEFTGRPVDIMGRSIPFSKGQSPIDALLTYIKTSKNKTPKKLREAAVVIIEPERYIGKIVWQINNAG